VQQDNTLHTKVNTCVMVNTTAGLEW